MSSKRGQPPKRKFEFGEWDGLCDIYVEGQKVRQAHSAKHGHVYLHLPPDYPDDAVTVHPFDPREPVTAEIQGGEVVLTEDGAAAALAAKEIADKQAALKREGELRRLKAKQVAEAAAKKNAEKRVAEALAKKAAADNEAKAAEAAKEGTD